MGQEDRLAGLAFTWKNYQAYSGSWEHDHCEFCFKKFLDPRYADWMREALAKPSEVGWSTYLNTLQFDYDQFVEEFDQVTTHVRDQMAAGAPA